MKNILEKIKSFRFPKVGLRTAKTLVSASIIAAIYSLIGRNPCFACVGAVFGMASTAVVGKNPGITRSVGTLIGGLVALPFYYLYHYTPFGIPNWVYLSLGLFCILYISQIFSVNHTIQPGVVMFYVVICTVQEYRYVSYVFARILDTVIGVAFACFVNWIWQKRAEKN